MTTNRLLALAVALTLGPGSARAADPPGDVRVTNFPEIQSIRGSVEILEPATTSRLLSISEDVVSPVPPEQTGNLVLAGTLEASGFRSVVLSLAGEVKSSYPTAGTVGALLIPDTPFIRKAFEDTGARLLPVRLDAHVAADGGSFFAVTYPRIDLAFPSYRVYFFNTTEQPASATLYAFLAN